MAATIEQNIGVLAAELPFDGKPDEVRLPHSLRTRVLAIVCAIVVILAFALAAYTTRQFDESTRLTIQHEGLLLSSAISSGIADMADKGDIEGIQAFLDRLIATRGRNDVEINVLFLRGKSSAVVASNVPDNIEDTDREEHAELLHVIARKLPYVVIETESDDGDPDDNPSSRLDPNHPDYYFPPGARLANITTPLIFGDRPIGSINIKLSLHFLDQQLDAVYHQVAVAVLAGVIGLLVVLVMYLNASLFTPLGRIAANIQQFGLGKFNGTWQHHSRDDEIGVLAGEFNDMVVRLSKAEAANKQYHRHLKQLVLDRTSELVATQEATILSLASLAENRDPETGGHIKRTQNYVRALAEQLRDHPRFRQYFNDENIELLYKSAPLHDIGKVGIADEILLKPGPLTAAEFEEMKKHPMLGRNAIQAAEEKLGPNSFLRYAREIAYTHQEKWDGTGYPQQLKGEEIPVSGRLMAVADVYDALISRRCYKPPFSHDVALQIIKDGRGRHFDPDMVDAFLEVAEKFRQIAIEFADTEEERAAVSRAVM